MAQMGPITLVMLRHHQIINKLLLDAEKVPEDDTYKFKKLFDAFKWNLDKHIFVEEEHIFPVADRNNKIELKQLQNLLKDHKDIKAIIENLEEEINDDRRPNVSIMRELLYKHEGREIDSFYPLLDSRLSSEKKKDIVERLKDIKLG
jgi:iron-sulfur cluster repair protein YtfE (RIC family)